MSRKVGLFGFFLTLLVLALSSCKSKIPPDTLVLVNQEPISQAELDEALNLNALEAPSSGRSLKADKKAPDERSMVLESLIDQRLILQEASRIKAELSPEDLENQLNLARGGLNEDEFKAALAAKALDYEAWAEAVKRRAEADEVVRSEIRSQISVSSQDLRDYYWEHVTEFRRSESVQLRQIFCSSRTAIHKALDELHLGENFADVAKRYSEAPEGPEGGELGWLERKDLPSKLSKEAFAMKPGHYSDVLLSSYGWHILYLEAKRPAQSLSLEESSPEIQEAILREREEPLYRNWLAKLRAQAEIIRLEPTIKEAP